MVERIEGFCSENDWKRAYNEINEFEKELDDWGAVIIKFWVQIDKDTQLERFSGKVRFRSFSSPVFIPISPSSNPSIRNMHESKPSRSSSRNSRKN